MKKMKKLMLAIAFMVFGIASVNAEISFKEIELSGLENSKAYDLKKTDGKYKYDKTLKGFVFTSSVGFTCTNDGDGDKKDDSEIKYYEYLVKPSGMVEPICPNEPDAKKEDKIIYRLSASDGDIYKDQYKNTVSTETRTSNVKFLETDDVTYGIHQTVAAGRLYDNVVNYIYVISKQPKSGTKIYAIYDAKGNKIVDFADIDTSAGSLKFVNAAVTPNGSAGYNVVGGNGILKNLKETDFTSKIGKNDKIKEIYVVAATSSTNYYVIDVDSSTDYSIILYDGKSGLEIVKDVSGTVRKFEDGVEKTLKNINGVVVYEKSGRFYSLDGKGVTSDSESTEVIEGKFLYKYNNTSIGFSSGSESLTKTKDELKVNEKFNIVYTGTVNNKYYFFTEVPDTYSVSSFKLQLFELSIDDTFNPEEPEVKKCVIDGNKYYDKDGKEVDKETYEKSCSPELPKYSCEEKDGKYYDKAGKEVDKQAYEKSCKTPEKDEPTNPSNPEKPGSSETPKYSCEIKDGKYYSKDGSVVDKKTYESVCGLDDNPHTGIALPIILVITLAGIGAFIYKTKGKDLFKKI